MPVLNPYERRMLKKREMTSRSPGQAVTAPAPQPSQPGVRPTITGNPQAANRVQRIRFGKQALRDFPRIGSIWAIEEDRSCGRSKKE